MSEATNGNARHLYRYEDILRAVGRYIDENGLQDVIILQSDNSVRIHGYRNVSAGGTASPALIEHVFTAEDIARIDDESRARRGSRSWFFG